MSKYYNINGLKVRVSDHEPNHAMNKFRGENDVEFYTKNITGQPMSIADQVEWYCDDNDLDIELFADLLEDFAIMPEYKVIAHQDDEDELSYTIYFSNGSVVKTTPLSRDEFEQLEYNTESDWKSSGIDFINL
jgi:hypothetical protein